jgi:hypothetical protein
MDGYAADALLLDCTVHWDVKLEWYLIHIDDIVITNRTNTGSHKACRGFSYL